MTRTLNEPFRFLDLPKELRLLVYEFLPPRVIRTKFVKTLGVAIVGSFTLISTFAPGAILATCKLVNGEAKSTVRSAPERALQYPTVEENDTQLNGTAPRLEAHVNSLEFLALEGGVLEAVAQWFHMIRQDYADRREPRFAAEQYRLSELFCGHGYVFDSGTTEQGNLRALDFVRKAGWMLYYLSQDCRLSEFQDAGCRPPQTRVNELRGPMLHIGLTQREDDAPGTYYGEVTELYGSIENLESTFGVCFVMHLLNIGRVAEEKSKEAWSEIRFAISDLRHSGEMTEGVHGFLKEGIFELDKFGAAAYKRYWRDHGWSQ